jgi:L-ribulokinase
MDGSLTGGYLGMRLEHGPGHLHRATLEGVALGLRRIVETLEAGGARAERVVATGGIAHRSDLLLRLIASSLGCEGGCGEGDGGREVLVPRVEHAVAAGAAVLGAVAGGGFGSAADAVAALVGSPASRPDTRRVAPVDGWPAQYDRLYGLYRQATDEWAREGSVARRLGGG